MGSMDLAIINVALPTLSRVFHASNASVQWTVIAYVLSLAIWIPASGRIADRIGTKRTFLIALTVFTLAARGQSAVSSGLTTFVEAIGVVAATQTAGRLYPRVGPRAMCTVGLVLLTAVIGSMATIDAQTSIWTIRAMMFMAGAANSMVFLPLQTSMFTSIAQADTGDASAIFNASRRDVARARGRHPLHRRGQRGRGELRRVPRRVRGGGTDRAHRQCHRVHPDPRRGCPRHDGATGGSSRRRLGPGPWTGRSVDAALTGVAHVAEHGCRPAEVGSTYHSKDQCRTDDAACGGSGGRLTSLEGDPLARTPLRQTDPSQIGRYRLVARLGAGGMGVVYLGVDPSGEQVAVKVLRPELADNPEFRVRFGREVTMLTRVQGVCTVRVIAADTEAPKPFLVTEYADGPSLSEYIDTRGPLDAGMLYGLATGLAEALTAIHAAGIVHRDLKPSNVLLTASGPKVIDFGIAQALDTTSLTKTGITVGSAGFMAPEQVIGKAGTAADIFTWAVTVAYAASGQSPFGTGASDVMLYRIVHAAPDITAVPPGLHPLVEAALAKEPRDRPTAPQLLSQLTHRPPRSHPWGTATPPRPSSRRPGTRPRRSHRAPAGPAGPPGTGSRRRAPAGYRAARRAPVIAPPQGPAPGRAHPGVPAGRRGHRRRFRAGRRVRRHARARGRQHDADPAGAAHPSHHARHHDDAAHLPGIEHHHPGHSRPRPPRPRPPRPRLPRPPRPRPRPLRPRPPRHPATTTRTTPATTTPATTAPATKSPASTGG